MQERVFGPYQHRRRWRVEIVRGDGAKVRESFADKETAERFAAQARRVTVGGKTMGDLIDEYKAAMEAKGNKPRSIATTVIRLNGWLDRSVPVASVSPAMVGKAYQDRVARLSVDTHRNELAQVRTFFEWAMRKGYVKRNPCADIEPQGRRSTGKEQLRRGEAAKLYRHLIAKGNGGDSSAVACLMALAAGMRASEIVGLASRDVDIAGRSVAVWIRDSKTRAGRRIVELAGDAAEVVRGYAERGSCRDLPWFFVARGGGHRSRTWILKAAKRHCKAAGVPEVCVHGLRGTFASLAVSAGVATTAVAAELGHENARVTTTNYATRDSQELGRSRAMLRVISGGA